MEFPLQLLTKNVIRETLTYFDRFDYPLTPYEVWYWQGTKPVSLLAIEKTLGQSQAYFCLPGRKLITKIRLKRYQYSQKKLQLLTGLVGKLKYISTIKAIFVTGALAMHNSPQTDDIDIMIITTPNTLWLTRPLVIAILKILKLRRDPHLTEHSSARVSDKFCDNLWLDSDHLSLPLHNLYQAHELLQAKCIYDQGGLFKKLISDNTWAKTFLPIAYNQTAHRVKTDEIHVSARSKIINLLIFFLNFLFFTVQYLYMHSHLTNERVGLGYAYFHPRKNS